MKKTILISLATVAALATSGMAMAHGDRDRGHGGWFGGWFHDGDRDGRDHDDWFDDDDDDDDDDDHHGASRMLDHLESSLSLTLDQKAQIQMIIDKQREAMTAQRESMREQLKELITADALTASQLLAITDGRQGSRELMQRSWAEALASIHGVLTPEQRAKAAELVGNWSGKGGRRGWRGWRRDRH